MSRVKRLGLTCAGVAALTATPAGAESLCIYTIKEQRATVTFKDIEGLAYNSNLKEELLTMKPQIECLVTRANDVICKTAWGGEAYTQDRGSNDEGTRIFITGFVDKSGRKLEIVTNNSAPPQFVAFKSDFKRKDVCGKFPIGSWFTTDSQYIDDEDNVYYILNGTKRRLAVGVSSKILLNPPENAASGEKGSF
jgi:hypothetical protein